MIYNEKTQPINKMAHKMFCNAKTILVLGLILFCSSMIMAQTSPNGYSFEHSWEYYSNFSQTNLGGFCQEDHIRFEMNLDGTVTITPDTLYLNSDTVLIRAVKLYNRIANGWYTFQFIVKKMINGSFVHQTTYNREFSYSSQECYDFNNITLAGNGKFEITFRLFNIRGQQVFYYSHVLVKTNSQQVVLINSHQDTLFKLRSPNSGIKRPMLCVEGFDYGNRNGLDTYRSVITSIENVSPGIFNGVDLYFLNFKDTSIDARENAMIVLGTIKYLYNLYQAETLMEGISVLGFSMGGIVSRYALAYAEHNDIAHHCTQLITFDSPHRGAVINTNLQDAMYQIYDAASSYLSNFGFICAPPKVRKLVAELRPLTGALNSPALRQLLRNNVRSAQYADEQNGSIDYRNLFSEINLEERLVYQPGNAVLNYDEGDPNSKPGYPYKQNSIKSLGVSNGWITKSGDTNGQHPEICTFYLPSLFGGTIHVYEQGWDTQPGSILGITPWLGGNNEHVTAYFDPVLVPLKSSLHLRPQGTNGYPDNPDLVMNVYDDIVPRDSSNNIITDYDGIADYLANHSLLDSVVLSNVANLHHIDISSFVVNESLPFLQDPLNRAIATISGNITNTDLTDIEMGVYVGASELPLDNKYYNLNPDGSWSVAYTFLRDMSVKIVFTKPDCLPTIRRYQMEYNEATGSIDDIVDQQVKLYDVNLNNILVSKTNTGSFNEIVDAVDFLVDYFDVNSYNGEAVRIRVLPGTYYYSIDLSPLVVKGITNFTLESNGEAIIKTGNYGIKLVVEEETVCSGAVYNIRNIKITANNPNSSNYRNIRGIIYMDQLGELAGDLPDPRITLNIQNCKIYECRSFRYSETISPIPSAAAIHFEGAGSVTDCDIRDNWIIGYDSLDSENFQAGGLFVNHNTSSLVEVSRNTFKNNDGGLAGGVVAKGKGSILIQDNKFLDNNDGGWCSIENAHDANELSVYNASDIVIRDNLFRSTSSEYGCIASLHTYVAQAALPIRFLNNTIINAPVGYTSSLSALRLWINSIALQDVHVINNVISSTDGSVTTLRNENGQNPQNISHNVFHNTNTLGFTPNLYDPYDPTSIYDPGTPNFNYQCDPKLDSNYIPVWTAEDKSYCIDNGHPDLNRNGIPWYEDPEDQDVGGTRKDIGAYQIPDQHINGFHRLTNSEVKYICIPGVENHPNNQGRNTLQYVFGEYGDNNLFETGYGAILDKITWIYNSDSGEASPTNVQEHCVHSQNGYKIRLLSDGPSEWDIVYSGFYPGYPLNPGMFHTELNRNTTKHFITVPDPDDENCHIDPDTGVLYRETYLGYYLQDSLRPFDALLPILDDITAILAEDWALVRIPIEGYDPQPGDPPSARYTDLWLGAVTMGLEDVAINHGEMVVVYYIGTDDVEFRLGGDNPDPPFTDHYTRDMAKHFKYEEQLGYIPVYISMDLNQYEDGNKPTEVALFIDEECKGAAVIKDDQIQLNAYITNEDDLEDDLKEVEFRLFFPSKSAHASVTEYAVYDMQTGRYESKPISASDFKGFLRVRLTSKCELPTPVTTQLFQNYPNPFNPVTFIKYDLAEDSRVRMDIYNVKGQLVKTLLNQEMSAGTHSVTWDGKDEGGRAVSSGVYFYRMSLPNKVLTNKMLLLKQNQLVIRVGVARHPCLS